MRTNIDIDDELLAQAMQLADVGTKKAMVHLALEEYVRNHSQRFLLDLFGTKRDEDFPPDVLADYLAHRAWE